MSDQAAADIQAAVNDGVPLVADVGVVVQDVKAGYKSTEFWLTVLGLLALNLNGVVLTLPDKYQAIASAVLAAAYAVSRGIAKKSA